MTALKVAFLDRDGVINTDIGYLHRVEDVAYPSHAIDGMRALAALGYTLVVVTNQSGIGRGFFADEDFRRVTQFLTNDLLRQGITLLDTYHCPHHPDDECDCRKPLPGMLLQAAADHDIDLGASVMIGDKQSDLEAGRAAGLAYRILISDTDAAVQESEVHVRDLQAAAAWLAARAAHVTPAG